MKPFISQSIIYFGVFALLCFNADSINFGQLLQMGGWTGQQTGIFVHAHVTFDEDEEN